jgi:putative ABC transport system ATP-binding protein
VDFRVSEASSFIIGPSGSGKRLLLNVLVAWTSRGSLRLNGVETSGLKERDLVRLRRDNIGFVFQQFYLMPTLTARENIEMPFSSAKEREQEQNRRYPADGGPCRQRRPPARTALRREMQRVAIGRALINDPKIILATSHGNLDSATSQMIFEAFQDLNRKV